MNLPLARAYLIELLGTFALVYFGAGIVCVNQLTLPLDQQPGVTALLGQHPGLVGMALAQGFILAATLAATMHVSGGFLNPAVTIMLWVFSRMESVRAAWLLGAQLLGGVLAGLCLRLTFAEGVLSAARLGTPHLSSQAYPRLEWGSLLSGTAVEFVLTFFLVFAIFGAILKKEAWQLQEDSPKTARPAADTALRTVDARLAGLVAGMTLSACVLFGFALTGAATNPARWFGTVLWEASLGTPVPDRSPFADMVVYIAGPILGALLAGLVYFKVMSANELQPEPSVQQPKTSTTAIRGKK
jgi:glycerol uptake facilitator-like aquaporin